MIKRIRSVLLAGFLVSAIVLPDVAAHPWGGLVIDKDGTVYFTFVCPFSSDNHYACVWRLRDNDVAASLTSERSPSDIVLARSPNRALYAGERYGSTGAFVASLWQMAAGTWELVVGPTRDDTAFHVQTFAVDDAGRVIYAVENALYVRSPEGTVTPLAVDKTFERIEVLTVGEDSRLYVLSRGTLYAVDLQTGTVEVRAANLKAAAPPRLPFSGANIIFDMAVAADGTAYLAYFGNREVLKVDPAGEVSAFLEAEGSWTPHGIDLYNGEVYVLESTVGGQPWWKFWVQTPLSPRIRKVAVSGQVDTLFEYEGER